MTVETAEAVTIDECRRCGAHPARGVQRVQYGIVYFKCDECGREQHEGVLEEVNRAQYEQKLGRERAKENRGRFMGEWAEKIRTDIGRAQEDFGDPLAVAEEGISRVINEVL